MPPTSPNVTKRIGLTIGPATEYPPTPAMLEGPTMDTTTEPITAPYHYHGYGHHKGHGKIGDGLGIASMATSKDVMHTVDLARNALSTDIRSVERATNENGIRLDGQINMVERSVNNAKDSLNERIVENGHRTLEGFRDMSVLTAKGIGEITTQITLVAKDGVIDAAKNTSLLQLQAERNAASATLLAAQNHSAAQAQLAECCCKLEGLVRDDGQKTRDLINFQAQRECDRRETDLKIQVSNLEQTEKLQGILKGLLGK